MRIKNQEPGIKTSQGASEKGFIAQMTVNGVFARRHDEACLPAGRQSVLTLEIACLR
jgi:hypothetical protein